MRLSCQEEEHQVSICSGNLDLLPQILSTSSEFPCADLLKGTDSFPFAPSAQRLSQGPVSQPRFRQPETGEEVFDFLEANPTRARQNLVAKWPIFHL